MDAFQLLIDQLNFSFGRRGDIDTVAANFDLIPAAESESGRQRIYITAGQNLIGCNLDDVRPFTADIAWYHTDLITQAQAATVANVSIQVITQAIRTGRLRSYRDLTAHKRQGRTLVRQSDVERLWPK